MKARRLTPLLWTEKLEETIDFYSTFLGFTCDNKNEDWGWAAMHNGEIEIMFAKPNQHTPFEKTGFTGSFYFLVDNVDELWEELKDKTRVVYPIESFDWEMREFAIFDNNNYTLQFGQELGDDCADS